MPPSENAVSLSEQELISAERRAAFVYLVIEDFERRGHLQTDLVTLHQTLFLMQVAAKIPLGLKFTLMPSVVELTPDIVHSFRFEIEVNALIGRAYSQVIVKDVLLIKTGVPSTVDKIKNKHKGSMHSYAGDIDHFLQMMAFLSPVSLDLVSLAFYMAKQQSQLPLLIRMQKYRRDTNPKLLEASKSLMAIFEEL